MCLHCVFVLNELTFEDVQAWFITVKYFYSFVILLFCLPSSFSSLSFSVFVVGSSQPLSPSLQPPPKTQIKGMMQTPHLSLTLDPFRASQLASGPGKSKKRLFIADVKTGTPPHTLLISMCKTKCGIKLCIHSTLQYQVTVCH